jgi:hypothetical protein
MKWLKDYWLLIAIVAAVAVFGWNYYQNSSLYDKLMNDYNAQAEAFERERSALETINRKAQERQRELVETHKQKIKEIEAQYKVRLGNISKETSKEKARLEASTPEILMDEVERTFGIPRYQGATTQ